jgi:four helix bundle protein
MLMRVTGNRKNEDFQNLRVWQNAKTIAVNIYRITSSKEFLKDYGLKDQIQRVSVSVARNH